MEQDVEERTGFVEACEFGKKEMVELLSNEYQSYIGKENMYMGFKSACSPVGEKVIPILTKNKALRSVVLQREANNITEEFRMTFIRTQFKRKGKSREYQISFDEKKVPLEVDISPLRTISEHTVQSKVSNRKKFNKFIL